MNFGLDKQPKVHYDNLKQIYKNYHNDPQY